MKRNLYYIFIFLIFVSACDRFYKKADKKAEEPPETKVIHIDKDITLKGDVRIIGIMQIEKGARLIILPGTKIEFAKIDTDKDGIGESGLNVYGDIIAEGKEEEPIIFTSASSDKNANDWQGVYIEGGHNSIF